MLVDWMLKGFNDFNWGDRGWMDIEADARCLSLAADMDELTRWRW